MTGLLNSFALAAGQVIDPAIMRILGKSLSVTLAIFLGLGVGLWFGLEHVLAAWNVAYSGALGTAITLIITVIGSWLLFRFVALAVLQFFADDVVHAVEARHYPVALSAARARSWHEELQGSLRSTGRAMLVNLLTLPFAIALLVTGIGTAVLFWAVNGWLLGRELQDMVWLRHQSSKNQAPPLSGAGRFALGGIVAALLAVPFINLLAPVIGAAAATHLVHRRQDTAHAA